MRFTIAAAILATSVMASHEAISTDYTTQLVTVTDCPPETPDCPAHEKTTAVTSTVLPLTTSVIYETKVHTITSCPPNVVKCPSHSTVVSTETIAVSTTICPVVETPTHYGNHTIPSYTKKAPPPAEETDCPPEESEKVPHGPGHTKSPKPTPEVCHTKSVTAITKSYTTVLTTVEYSTIEVPCPTGDHGVPTGQVPPPAVTTPVEPVPTKPIDDGCKGGNCTVPVTPPPVTAGAASFAGSAIFAAAAGIAAYILV